MQFKKYNKMSRIPENNENNKNKNRRIFKALLIFLTQLIIPISYPYVVAQPSTTSSAESQKNDVIPNEVKKIETDIIKGQSLDFKNGTAFTPLKILGFGNSTIVIEIKNNRALRIPRLREMQSDMEQDEIRNRLAEFHLGSQLLIDQNVPIPKILEIGIEPQTSNIEYIVTEKVTAKYSLHDRLLKIRQQPLNAQEWVALSLFARSISAFAIIADFAPRQLIWTGKKWMLVDWMKSHDLAQTINDEDPFSSWLKFRLKADSLGESADQVIQHLSKTIRKHRKHRKHHFCDRELSSQWQQIHNPHLDYYTTSDP